MKLGTALLAGAGAFLFFGYTETGKKWGKVIVEKAKEFSADIKKNAKTKTDTTKDGTVKEDTGTEGVEQLNPVIPEQEKKIEIITPKGEIPVVQAAGKTRKFSKKQASGASNWHAKW